MTLSESVGKVDKKYGKGTIMKMGDAPDMGIEVLPTGCITLDIALGVGGYAKGRTVEIYGPESSGKTTLTLHAIAEAQKLGGTAAFIDAEHSLDPTYAANIGVNVPELYICQPSYGEMALDVARELTESGEIAIVAIDSVAALTPLAELEGDIGDAHVGRQARLMSQALRILTGAASKTGTVLLFVNQIREKVGVMFGSPETTPGGRALKFYSSQRLEIRRIESIKQGAEIVGNRTRVKVVKNKVAPPFRQAEFDIMYGEGVSQSGAVLDLAVDRGLAKKSGAWYTDLNTGEQMGQGREAAKLYLTENPDVLARFYEGITGEE